MRAVQARHPHEQQAQYPIRTVSELTGVNAITLRAWEKRHGLVRPTRTESGHRVYSQEQIDLINRIVGLLDRGMRIGQVREVLEGDSDKSAVDAPAADPWKRSLDGMVAAVIRFDEEALESVYNEALSRYPVEQVMRQLVTPLLVELGNRWESGLGSVAEEHFFGFYLRNKLGARFHHRARPTAGPRLLLACLPGERHEIGLLLFALAANAAGYQVVVLGSDMPLEEMAAAAAKTGSAAIVLSGLLKPSGKTLQASLASLVESSKVPVFLGGRASVEALDALKRIGVVSLGTDTDAGLKRLQSAIPLPA